MAKNTHMEHLEDAIFNLGIEGTRESVNFLIQMRETLNGTAQRALRTSVKWDGAPAIFIGEHPETKQFIVAKKSLFNKTPLYYTSIAEINRTTDLSAELKGKFREAFNGYKDAGIKGIIQGDFLWENKDLKKETIDGEDVITFHPNTIVYSVPVSSELGQKIAKSRFGIVWHTTYSGSSIEKMRSSFGVRMPKQPRNGVQFDAMYNDVSGSASLTMKESNELARTLTTAGQNFKKVSRNTFDIINQEEISMICKTYVNTFIRGNRMPPAGELASGLVPYIQAKFLKEMDTKKTPRGKKTVRERMMRVVKPLQSVGGQQLLHVFQLYTSLTHAKNLLVKKLNSASFIKTFLKTKDGWKVTGQEGFVAIDRTGTKAVKMVDRLDFSYANFSPDIIKGWQTDLRR